MPLRHLLAAALAALFFALAFGFSTAPASASTIKLNQAQEMCKANKKCTDYNTDPGNANADHVLCVKGGGCVYCMGDSQNCYAALTGGGAGLAGIDPSTVLMSGGSSQKPKLTAGAATNTNTGGYKISGGSSQPSGPTKPAGPTPPPGGYSIGH